MKKTFTKILSVLILSSMMVSVFSITTIASNATDSPSFRRNKDIAWPTFQGSIYSKNAILIDANSNCLLYDKGADEKIYPASLTKILTALVVMEYVSSLDDVFVFSASAITEDIDRDSTTIGAVYGDRLTIKEGLYCLLLASANDVANALAEHIAGNNRDFALLMNDLAKRIGCTNSNFVNPTGMHDDNHYSTCTDLAKIVSYALKYELFTQITSAISYRHAPIRKYKDPENSNNVVYNTDRMLATTNPYHVRGIISGKTGHTELAGYNLSTVVKQNNTTLIAITCNSAKINQRYADTKQILNWAYSNFKSLQINMTDPRFSKNIGNLSIDGIDVITPQIINVDTDKFITLPKEVYFEDLTSTLSFSQKDENDPSSVGLVQYYYKDMLVGSASIKGTKTLDMNSIDISNIPTRKKDDGSVERKISTVPRDPLIKYENGQFIINPSFIKYVILFISTLIGIFIITLIHSNRKQRRYK